MWMGSGAHVFGSAQRLGFARLFVCTAFLGSFVAAAQPADATVQQAVKSSIVGTVGEMPSDIESPRAAGECNSPSVNRRCELKRRAIEVFLKCLLHHEATCDDPPG